MSTVGEANFFLGWLVSLNTLSVVSSAIAAYLRLVWAILAFLEGQFSTAKCLYDGASTFHGECSNSVIAPSQIAAITLQTKQIFLCNSQFPPYISINKSLGSQTKGSNVTTSRRWKKRPISLLLTYLSPLLPLNTITPSFSSIQVLY